VKILLGSDNEKGIELGVELAKKYIVQLELPIRSYPSVAEDICYLLNAGVGEKAILVCKSGIGMCIVANRFPGIRAVRGDCLSTVTRARKRNDCNILCLGSDYLLIEEMAELVMRFLETEYEGESDENLKYIENITYNLHL